MEDATTKADPLAGIESVFQASIDRQQMAGAVTLAWQAGEIVHFAATGWCDIENRVPMTRDSLFRIASMTKPIVSLAVLMLVEEGRLAVDAPVSRWLPELAGRQVLEDPKGPLDRVRPAAREITLDDLLTHRAGYADFFCSQGPISAAYQERLYAPGQATMTTDEWLAALATLPLVHQPGDRFEYGCSTDVLGALLARVEGQSLGEVLKRRIFDPLGMKDTGFWVPPEQQHRLAHTYFAEPNSGTLIDATTPLPPAPPRFESGAGGLYSTAEDYLKFARMLMAGGKPLARPETVALMATNRLTDEQRRYGFWTLQDFWTPQGFGLGLASVTNPDCPTLEAPGSAGAYGWPGAFGTWWVGDPARDLILIYLVQDIFPMTPDTIAQLVTGERPGARSGRVAFQRMAYERL